MLVTESSVCKVADFGLSRDLADDSDYETKVRQSTNISVGIGLGCLTVLEKFNIEAFTKL